ncbi:hypothetical protein BgiMline_012787, partial [Biomphalaria glabrata]
MLRISCGGKGQKVVADGEQVQLFLSSDVIVGCLPCKQQTQGSFITEFIQKNLFVSHTAAIGILESK